MRVSSNCSSLLRHSTGIRGHHPAWRQTSLRICRGNCAQSHSYHQEGEKFTGAWEPIPPDLMVVVGEVAESCNRGRRSVCSPKRLCEDSVYILGDTSCRDVHGHLWELKIAVGRSCERMVLIMRAAGLHPGRLCFGSEVSHTLGVQ